MLSSVGLNFLIGDTYLLPLTIFFMLLALGMLGYKAAQRRGYLPLTIGMVGAVAIVVGKFYLENYSLSKVGIYLLIVASIWNAWPRKGGSGTTDDLQLHDGNIR